MPATQKTLNIHQRMLAITADAEVAKGGTAPGAVGGFAFHKIDDVEAVLKPLFVKHGVTAVPTVVTMDFALNGSWNHATARVDITFTNADDKEDKVILSSYGQGFDKQDKGAGKAISYACKNAYLSVFHLKGQPDNETDAQEEHVPAPQTDSTSHSLDPTIYVSFGKNAEKRWDELTSNQVKWYAENAKSEDTRNIALAQLYSRVADIDEILPPKDDGDLPF